MHSNSTHLLLCWNNLLWQLFYILSIFLLKSSNVTLGEIIIKVPFQGRKGESIIKSLNNTLKRTLPENAECRVVQTGTKLSQFFNIKDRIDEKHRSNFIYHHECQNRKCDEDYIGETKRRRENRTGEHSGKDKNSEIFKHSCSTKHPKAKDKNFKILATNYENRRKRKLAEAMFIRDLKPSLNIQRDSYKLILFWRHRHNLQHIWRQIEHIVKMFISCNVTVFSYCWTMPRSERRNIQWIKMLTLLVITFLIKTLARTNLYNSYDIILMLMFSDFW